MRNYGYMTGSANIVDLKGADIKIEKTPTEELRLSRRDPLLSWEDDGGAMYCHAAQDDILPTEADDEEHLLSQEDVDFTIKAHEATIERFLDFEERLKEAVSRERAYLSMMVLGA